MYFQEVFEYRFVKGGRKYHYSADTLANKPSCFLFSKAEGAFRIISNQTILHLFPLVSIGETTLENPSMS